MKTKEQIDEMKELQSQGKTQEEIASILKTNQGMVSYYLTNGARKKRIDSARSRFLKLTPKQRKKVYDSRKEYTKNYKRKKYQTDEKYREIQKKRARECNKKLRIKNKHKEV